MSRSVSATEAKNTLGALLRVVSEDNEIIVVENRREPTAVIVSYGQFEEYQRIKDEHRKQVALEQFRELSAKLAEKNQDLSNEEVEAISQRAVRESIESLIEQGVIRLEQ